MTSSTRSPVFAALLLGFCASGCASTSDFPSLAKRPFESVVAPGAPEQTVIPADTALLTRIAGITARAADARPAFESALKSGAAIIARGSGAARGSEAWVLAQMEVSQIERSRAPITSALAELDTEFRQANLSGKTADVAAVRAALETVQQIDKDQAAALASLEGRLTGQ